ncbi:MAG: VIT domain-containing protein [bacterium]
MAFCAGASALADGILVPGIWPEPSPRPAVAELPPNFAVKYHHVDVEIEDQTSKTKIDQVFKNEWNREIEATYIFPMPEDAAINDFSMWVGEEKVKGEILTAEEARRIYEDIVRRRKDPALLEYLERGLFRARVFPIEANGEKRIALDYVQLNHFENDTHRYTYPLNTEKFSSRPIESVRVTVNIRTTRPLRNIYCPTHSVSIRRVDEHNATVTYEENNVKPDADLTIYYSTDDRDVGLSLLTYREKGDDGFFMLLAAPKTEVMKKEIAAKDVIFVLDRTGSMSGEKMEQARESLKFCLRTLNEKDRFNVIAFNEAPDPLFSGLVSADKKNLDGAIDFANGLDAVGGTNIDEALTVAMKQLKGRGGEAPGFLLFLTDGLPTVGVTDEKQIITDVEKVAPGNIRIFAFGVGYDVNTRLLDGLTAGHHGAPEYVRPGEDIEVKVSNLFRKISYPILSNLELDWGKLKAYDVFPPELPDLFKGSQVVLTGRYRGKKKTTVVLKGTAEGKTYKFDIVARPNKSGKFNDFIPLLWAQRKIAYLVDEVRNKGRNKELIDEIVRLSKKYGIITEYTSFLVREPGMAFAEAETQAEELDAFMETAAAPSSGGWAVNQSVNLAKQKAGARAPQSVQSFYDAEGNEVLIDQVRNVAGKTFFQQQDNWMENTYEKDQDVLTIKVFSEAYFQLLDSDPSLGRYMAMGKRVLLVLNGNAVQIEPEKGKEKLSVKELKLLIP